MKKHIVFISILLIILLSFLVIVPEVSISACLTGINVWATSILPALFPFFFFTKLLGDLGFITYISRGVAPLTKHLFNTSGISSYVYLMSILSGYPVGAKITSDLYENKIIDLGEAHRIVTFTSTSGPLFILGTVAVGMFENKTIGYVVLLAHFIGAIVNGLCYRKYMLKTEKTIKPNNVSATQTENILENCMFSSIKSILIVGGYIAIFFMLITIFNHFNLFLPITFVLSKIFPNLNENIITSVLNGIIELTRGCLDLSTCGLNLNVSAIILSGLISFGGISINLQALTFLKKMNINLKFYLCQKLTHALFSMVLAFLFGLVILWFSN